MQEGWGCIRNLSTPPNSIYRLIRASICPLARDSPRCREPYGQRHTPPSGRIKPILPIHFCFAEKRRGQRRVMMPVLLPLKWPHQHVKADLMRARSCWSPNHCLKVGGPNFTAKGSNWRRKRNRRSAVTAGGFSSCWRKQQPQSALLSRSGNNEF